MWARGDGVEPYWRDVGTIDAFWEANLNLAANMPKLNIYDKDWPVWTTQEQLQPAKFVPDRKGAWCYYEYFSCQWLYCFRFRDIKIAYVFKR